MSISLTELNKHGYPTTAGINANLAILLERINKVRDAYGKPMIVTSGLRSQSQQQELIKAGSSTATKSKHLIGAAVDILDMNGSLKSWVKDNVTLMESIGLWMEDFAHTPNWAHFQIFPPKSGHRFFIP